MNITKLSYTIKKAISLTLTVFMLAGLLPILPAYAESIDALTVTFGDPSSLSDGEIDVQVGAVNGGTLYYMLSLTSGATPQVGALLSDLTVQPLATPPDAALEGQYVRVYEVNAGEIVAYGEAQVTAGEIGDIIHQEESRSIDGNTTIKSGLSGDYTIEFTTAGSGWVVIGGGYNISFGPGNAGSTFTVNGPSGWFARMTNNESDVVPSAGTTTTYKLTSTGNTFADLSLAFTNSVDGTSPALTPTWAGNINAAYKSPNGELTLNNQGTLNVTDMLIRKISGNSGKTEVNSVSINDGGTTLSAVIDPSAASSSVLYEWSIEDEDLGRVVIDTNETLTNVPDGKRIYLTVLGKDSYYGMADTFVRSDAGTTAPDAIKGLTVVFTGDPDNMDDGQISADISETPEGTLRYRITTSEGTKPADGTNAPAAAQAFTPNTPFGTGVTYKQYLHIYDVDNTGLILGYGVKRVAWDAIGTIVHQAATPSYVGAHWGQYIANLPANYSLEFEAEFGASSSLAVYPRTKDDGSWHAFSRFDITTTQISAPAIADTSENITNSITGGPFSYTIGAGSNKYRVVVQGQHGTPDPNDRFTAAISYYDPDDWQAIGTFTSTAAGGGNNLGFWPTNVTLSNVIIRAIRSEPDDIDAPPLGDVTFTAPMLDLGIENGGGVNAGTGSSYFPRPTATRTFYIDSRATSGGDGSIGSPFNTLAPISAGTVQPGDHFYIAAGSIFNNVRIAAGADGTAAAPIVIDMYGVGAKPVLNGWNSSGGDSQSGSVITINRAYWELRNLNIMFWNGLTMNGPSNDSIDRTAITANAGTVNLATKAGGKDHLYIIDCVIEKIDSNKFNTMAGGILTHGAWRELRIVGNTMVDVNRTAMRIGNQNASWTATTGPFFANDNDMYYKANDILIALNFMDRIGGDAIIIDYCFNAVIEYNTIYRPCHDLPQEGPSGSNLYSGGAWAWESANIIYQFNEIAYTRDGGVGDRVALNFDNGLSGYHICQYNYTHHNAGGQLLTMPIGHSNAHKVAEYIFGTRVLRYNVSAYEAFSSGSASPTGNTLMYNNLYYRSSKGKTNTDRMFDQDGLLYSNSDRSDPTIPWDNWDVPSLGDTENRSYSNYIFNNIFYNCGQIAYNGINTATHNNNAGMVFSLLHLFNNNLLYNTDVYKMGRGGTITKLSDSELQANNNVVENPLFVGEIDPLDADGFDVLNALKMLDTSPAIGAGISIEDMLDKIENAIPDANAANTSANVELNFDDLRMEPLTGDLKTTVDFFGNQLSVGSTDIGIGGVASGHDEPVITEMSIGEAVQWITMPVNPDDGSYPSPALSADAVITLKGVQLTGTEVLKAFGQTRAIAATDAEQQLTITAAQADVKLGRNYFRVETADGTLLKLGWIVIVNEPFIGAYAPDGLTLAHGDTLDTGKVGIGSVGLGNVNPFNHTIDDIYYVVAMSAGTAPTPGSDISEILGAQQISIGEPIEGALHQDQWIRVYTVDGSGKITGYDTKQILWDNVGNIFFRADDPGTVTGNNQFVAMSPEYDFGYRLEFDMQRVSGTGDSNVYVSHNGSSVTGSSTWMRFGWNPGGDTHWHEFAMRNTAGTQHDEDPHGWALEALANAPYGEIHYRFIVDNTTVTHGGGNPQQPQTDISLYAWMTDASLGIDDFYQNKYRWGSGDYGQVPYGKSGYQIANGTTVTIRNWYHHSLDTDPYADKTQITSVAVTDTAGILSANIQPAGATVAYEWSLVDPVAGSIILGKNATFDVSAYKGKTIILTVAGMGSYAGVASSNFNSDPDPDLNEVAADAFRDAHALALALTTSTVGISDETIVRAALTAYSALGTDVKALLTVEKALLDSLLSKIDALKNSGTTTPSTRSKSSSSGGGSSKKDSTLAPNQWLEPTAAQMLSSNAKQKNEDIVRTKSTYTYGVRKDSWQKLKGHRFEHDTMDAGTIQVRLYIDNPAAIKRDAYVTAYVKGAFVESRKAMFEKYFSNKVQIIHMDESAPWGQDVKIAAKVDLSKMNTDNLYFYSYNTQAHKYIHIKEAKYYVDKNGYLHFYTPYSGDIVISENPLARK